jgi:hypothetical protein
MVSRLLRSQWFGKLLVCVFLISFCVLPFASAAEQSANLPKRALGDEWRFLVDYKGDEGIQFNLTTTLTETTIRNPSGNTECFQLSSVGSGIVYGANVSGAASFLFKEYYTKSDSGLTEIYQNRTTTTDRSGITNRSSSAANTVYTPPFGINSGFPLSVGKTWTANSTAAITANADNDGVISQENSTSQVSMNFVVDRIETISVRAGQFETYVIKGTGVDGSVQEIFYAPTVGMQVKEVDSDAAGNVVATMELLDYSVAESTGTVPVYWVALAIVGIAIVISATGAITYRRRNQKNKTAHSPAEAPAKTNLSQHLT